MEAKKVAQALGGLLLGVGCGVYAGAAIEVQATKVEDLEGLFLATGCGAYAGEAIEVESI